MLHVPALKPDQESFDGSQDALLHPRLQTGSHSLPLSHTAAPGAVADSSGNAADEQPDPAHILDHTLAKDAVTSLHIEDDEQRQKLLAYSHSQICDIIPDYPRFIKAQVYRGLLDTSAGEHAARMTAMDNATRNCNELISDLTLLYNKTRQAAITTELIDIVGGVEALKG